MLCLFCPYVHPFDPQEAQEPHKLAGTDVFLQKNEPTNSNRLQAPRSNTTTAGVVTMAGDGNQRPFRNMAAADGMGWE